MSDWIEFTKMHGAGNDFVVLDATAQELPPLEAFSRRICDRSSGRYCRKYNQWQ
jgi:diaminopimelate epimerase